MNSAATSVINTVIGIYARNFPRTPGSTIMGINTTSVVIVPAIRGALKSLTAMRTAVFGLNHILRFSYAHSMITIVVSIAIPRVRTREKLVRKFSVRSISWRTMNVTINASGIAKVAMTASLSPTNSNRQQKTHTSVRSPLLARSA